MKNLKTPGRKAGLLTFQIFLVVIILLVGFWIGSRPATGSSTDQPEASVHNTH
ncbi:MAG TPA: hypothetical protein VK589_00170 [Chryseolinea sp.]|nr:hypothetical protein [Chryseolinea sp.]